MIDRRALVAGLACAPWASASRAQAYPARPVGLIVPFPAGGPADLVARIVKEEMERRLGQPVVVDNRGGAGGTLGAGLVAAAPPDGYQIGLISTGAVTILPHLMTTLRYDPLRDLVPIGLAITTPQILVVAPGLGVANVADLVARARARPGELNYGSAGIGSSLHMAGELFRLKAGVAVTHVPYRGAAPALADLIGGRIQFMLADAPAFLSQIQAGALKGLGVTGKRRLAVLPEIPTMEEAGFDVVCETWYGLMAPKGTPEPALARLTDALAAALATPTIRERLEGQGGLVATPDRAAFAAYIRADYARWGDVVKTAGIKLDP